MRNNLEVQCTGRRQNFKTHVHVAVHVSEGRHRVQTRTHQSKGQLPATISLLRRTSTVHVSKEKEVRKSFTQSLVHVHALRDANLILKKCC